MDQASGDEQEPSSAAFGLGVFVRDDEAHEQHPEIIHHQQQARGQFGGGAGLGAEAGKAPLVLEFVEDVFGVCPLAVLLQDLPGVKLRRQAGHIHGEHVPCPRKSVAL